MQYYCLQHARYSSKNHLTPNIKAILEELLQPEPAEIHYSMKTHADMMLTLFDDKCRSVAQVDDDRRTYNNTYSIYHVITYLNIKRTHETQLYTPEIIHCTFKPNYQNAARTIILAYTSYSIAIAWVGPTGLACCCCWWCCVVSVSL